MTEVRAKLIVDRVACCGSGLCVAVAPDLLDLGEEGFAVLLVEAVPEERERVARDAVQACPMRALQYVAAQVRQPSAEEPTKCPS